MPAWFLYFRLFFFFSSLSSFLSSVGKPARFHNFQIRPSIFCRKTSARKCVITINTSDLYEHTIESFPFSISPYGIAAVLLNMPELLGITVSVKFPPTFPLSAFWLLPHELNSWCIATHCRIVLCHKMRGTLLEMRANFERMPCSRRREIFFLLLYFRVIFPILFLGCCPRQSKFRVAKK